MNDALNIKGLTVKIGASAILTDVSFSLRPGEVTGLIGRSGSGKSMTALAIMGLTPSVAQVSGNVLIDGQDMLSAGEKTRCDMRGRKVAMIFQEPMTALNPLQSIGDQVAEVFLSHQKMSREDARNKAELALARAGLPSEQVSPSRLPHELSGGQRQRVVIAIAIALKPRLLIADEPTTALDVTTQAEILDLLKSLAVQDNCALLLITHDLAVVSRLADNIVVMDSGAVVENSSAQAFYSLAPGSRATSFLPAAFARKSSPTSAAETLLETQGLSCDYAVRQSSIFHEEQTFRAVDKFDLKIGKGENVGLVGESGCGKSTLAKALLGLHPVAEGSVSISGERFPTQDRSAMKRMRRRMQIVFQDPYSSFNPRHRIVDIVTEPLHLLDEALPSSQKRDRAAELLESVGLDIHALDKYPHAFSGGQRQRIAIARALATDPDLIVLDEATSALDIASRNRVLELLQSLSERRPISLLFITHDLSVVRDVTDRIMVMRSGKLVESGPTKQIFESPKEAYTKRLIDAAPVIRWRHMESEDA